jgi:hypothetical protein
MQRMGATSRKTPAELHFPSPKAPGHEDALPGGGTLEALPTWQRRDREKMPAAACSSIFAISQRL